MNRILGILLALVLGAIAGTVVGACSGSCEYRSEPAPITAAPPLKIIGSWPIDNGYVKRLHDDETGVTCWLYREVKSGAYEYALGIGLSCVADWMLTKPPAEKP